jgi:hypothetical protein
MIFSFNAANHRRQKSEQQRSGAFHAQVDAVVRLYLIFI